MEIIPPPTQISITYHPGHIYCPLTVLLQALSPSQALLRPHSNHILHCLSLGDPGTGVSPSPVKWSWPNLTFIKPFRRPWPPTQNKQSVSKDYVKFELFSFPWPLLTTGSQRSVWLWKAARDSAMVRKQGHILKGKKGEGGILSRG